DAPQHLAQRRSSANAGADLLRRFRDQRGTLRTYRAKQLGMSKGESQGSVSAHGHAGDAARCALPADGVMRLDVGDEFLQEEIAIANPAIGGVDIETDLRLGSDDEKVADLFLLP